MRTMPINATLLKNLETIYRKKLSTVNTILPKIKDITISQSFDNSSRHAAGEFYPDRVMNKQHDAKKAAAESDAEVIDRMIELIKDLALRATLIHVHENFSNPENYNSPLAKSYREDAAAREELVKLIHANYTQALFENPENYQTLFDTYQKDLAEAQKYVEPTLKNTNNITRLTTPEFFFYPDRNRGPLSIAAFKTFLLKIEAIASDCPDNLHLMLASIPVQLDNGLVQNIVVFAECGATPTLHTFTKAISSHIDPVYPNSHNPNFSSTLMEEKILNNMQAVIQMNAEFLVMEDFKNQLAKLLISNPEDLFQIETLSNEINAQINRLKKPMTLIVNTIAALEKNPASHNNANILKIFNSIKILAANEKSYPAEAEALAREWNNYVLHRSDRTQNIVAGALASEQDHQNDMAMNIFYSGNILCKTVGGAIFRTAADICIDNYFKISKQRVSQDIQSAQHESQTMLPHHASYSVVSNSISVRESGIVSENITQADADFFRSGTKKSILPDQPAEQAQNITEPAFGPQIALSIYPSRELSSHYGELDLQINNHNNFMVRLSALRQYRTHRPTETMAVHQEIEKHIYRYLITQLEYAEKEMGEEIFIPLFHEETGYPINIITVQGLMQFEIAVHYHPELAQDKLTTLNAIQLCYTLLDNEQKEMLQNAAAVVLPSETRETMLIQAIHYFHYHVAKPSYKYSLTQLMEIFQRIGDHLNYHGYSTTKEKDNLQKLFSILKDLYISSKDKIIIESAVAQLPLSLLLEMRNTALLYLVNNPELFILTNAIGINNLPITLKQLSFFQVHSSTAEMFIVDAIDSFVREENFKCSPAVNTALWNYLLSDADLVKNLNVQKWFLTPQETNDSEHYVFEDKKSYDILKALTILRPDTSTLPSAIYNRYFLFINLIPILATALNTYREKNNLPHYAYSESQAKGLIKPSLNKAGMTGYKRAKKIFDGLATPDSYQVVLEMVIQILESKPNKLNLLRDDSASLQYCLQSEFNKNNITFAKLNTLLSFYIPAKPRP